MNIMVFIIVLQIKMLEMLYVWNLLWTQEAIITRIRSTEFLRCIWENTYKNYL